MPMKPINASEEELIGCCDLQLANTEAGFTAVLVQQFANVMTIDLIITDASETLTEKEDQNSIKM